VRLHFSRFVAVFIWRGGRSQVIISYFRWRVWGNHYPFNNVFIFRVDFQVRGICMMAVSCKVWFYEILLWLSNIDILHSCQIFQILSIPCDSLPWWPSFIPTNTGSSSVEYSHEPIVRVNRKRKNQRLWWPPHGVFDISSLSPYFKHSRHTLLNVLLKSDQSPYNKSLDMDTQLMEDDGED